MTPNLIHISEGADAGTHAAIKPESLVGSASILRSLGKTLRENGFTYRIERVTRKNFNHSWKGYRGLSIVVSNEGYQSLFTGKKANA